MPKGLHNGYSATQARLTSCKYDLSGFRESDRQRFWVKVDKTHSCWPWTASGTGGKGNWYGQFSYGGKDLYAHRVAWILAYGPIPDGLEVCHHCDVPRCCNPSHLFLGTHRDNNRDAARKGRFRVPRPSRQKLTPDQLTEIDTLIASGGRGVQAEIAQRYGVSKSWVSKYTRGERRQYDRPATPRKTKAA